MSDRDCVPSLMIEGSWSVQAHILIHPFSPKVPTSPIPITAPHPFPWMGAWSAARRGYFLSTLHRPSFRRRVRSSVTVKPKQNEEGGYGGYWLLLLLPFFLSEERPPQSRLVGRCLVVCRYKTTFWL